MMKANVDILELRFTGNGINPQGVKARELADLIRGLEDALFAIVHRDNPEIKEDEIFISVVGIEDQSLGLKNIPNLRSVTVAGFVALAASIGLDTLERLPIKSIEGLQVISRFVKKKRCTAEFKINNEVLVSINADSKLDLPKAVHIKGETTIYPEIKRAGGSTPSVVLKLPENENLIYVETTEEIAKQLGQRLYETVGLTGTATWEKDTYSIIDFKISEILPYRGIVSFASFKAKSKGMGKYWDDVEDVNLILMRGGDDGY